MSRVRYKPTTSERIYDGGWYLVRLSDEDHEAAKELGLENKIGKPLTKKAADEARDLINARADQIRTYRERGQEPPPVKSD